MTMVRILFERVGGVRVSALDPVLGEER